MTERESFATLISEVQHTAEQALVRGNVLPRLDMWSHNNPVCLFAALGPSLTGWDQLEPTFRSVASRLSGGRDVTYEITAFDVIGDHAWTAGFSRFKARMDGGPLSSYALRITHVYRREGGQWKVVHEHSNFEPGEG